MGEGHRPIQSVFILKRPYPDLPPSVPVVPIELPADRRHPTDASVVAVGAHRAVDAQHDPPSVGAGWLSQSQAVGERFSLVNGQRGRRHLHSPGDLGVYPRHHRWGNTLNVEAEVKTVNTDVHRIDLDRLSQDERQLLLELITKVRGDGVGQ